MKNRIWELDALRGLFILGMVVVHLLYDLSSLFGLIRLDNVWLYHFVKDWGGLLFFLLSGICVTLGSHPVRRGLLIIAGGMLCTAVTIGMYQLQLADKSIIIYFGVLQCLGCCMLLWPLLQKAPNRLLAVLGISIIAAGFRLQTLSFDFPWLLPLGFMPHGFASSDYFPLLPNLGFFLLGAVLGRRLYPRRQSLLPRVNQDFFLFRFLRFCGKHSLIIYLAHQPVLAGLIMFLS